MYNTGARWCDRERAVKRKSKKVAVVAFFMRMTLLSTMEKTVNPNSVSMNQAGQSRFFTHESMHFHLGAKSRIPYAYGNSEVSNHCQ